ncbi:hypothetical protein U9M48_037226 [Paspalum notatum var. saurae]|uniref:CSC1/OSCA1-like N-terminal transmembrane domain-containing protein n=1 Tax=Paspalum notatum var. saurae TaxID=547442 RepID=A0AAQ3UF68_PASNO
MILSALATSVGLNLALTVLLAAAYSLLRRRPQYVEVYAPRRPYAPLDEHWLAAAWRRSEEDIHAAAGLDGVIFLRIFVFWSFWAALGPAPLLPLCRSCSSPPNPIGSVPLLTGMRLGYRVVAQHQGVRGGRGARARGAPAGQLPGAPAEGDRLRRPAQQVHRSLQHLQRPGRLQQEYKYISGKRLDYFMTSKPLPQHFTVLVRAIPVSDGISVGDAVDKFFREYHSSTYLSHTVVHQTGKLRRLLIDAVHTF